MSNNLARKIQFTVTLEQANLRLDRLLATLDFIASRTRAAELIERGLVTSKGKALKASFRAQARTLIEVELPAPAPTSLLPLDAPLEILFEDEDLLVLNKPARLVVHPAAGHAQDTLVNILLHHVKHLAMGFGENRPGIVHRLDRDTSGVLVVAKNDFTHHHLAAQFRTKSVHRIYWALVYGVPVVRARTIRSHLARHPKDRKRFASTGTTEGKLAITHYKVLATLPAKWSWLECRLETGRTHQIRIHLSEAGHPIVGDKVYGSRSREQQVASRYAAEIQGLNRVALHACELGFIHPRKNSQMLFRAPWPEELRHLATTLGFTNV